MSEDKEICPFIRLCLSPRENLRGYLLRLTTVNELRASFLHHLLWKSERDSRAKAIGMLCNWTANTPQYVTPLFDPRYRRSAPVPGHVLPRSMIHPGARICPACLARDGIAESAWSLRLYIGCSEHRMLLADSCPSCNRTLQWDRPGIRRCFCGHDLAKIRTDPLPSEDVELMSMIRSACSQSNSRNCGFPRSPAELSLLDLLTMIMLVNLKDDASSWWLGLWNCTESNVTGLVQRATRALTDWPNGIRNLLCTVLAPGVDEPVRPAPIEGGKLIQALNSSGEAGLQPAIRNMVLEEVYRVVKGKHYVRLNPDILLSHSDFNVPYLTSSQSAAILGFCPRTVVRIARQANIRKITHWYRKSIFLYTKEDIQTLFKELLSEKALLSDFTSLNTVSFLLGTRPTNVKSLVSLGLLTTRSTHNAFLYSKKDALKIIQKMEGLAKGNEPGEFDCRILAAVKRWPWLSVAQLIKAVLDGSIMISAHPTPPNIRSARQRCRGINAFLLAHDETLAFAVSTMTHLTAKQAQQHLRIPQRSFCELIERGYLRTDDGSIPRRNGAASISLETINGFLALYTHTAELRRSMPRGTQVRVVLRNLGVMPTDEFSPRFGIYERQTVAEALGRPDFLRPKR